MERRSLGRKALMLACVMLTCTLGCGKKKSPPGAPLPPGQGLRLETVETGLAFPLFLTAAPGDGTRLFVVEKVGRIQIIRNDTLVTTPFLDLSPLVSTGGEQGLLGMAFDPDYATNGRFYVSYTDLNGNSRIARCLVSGNPDVAVAAVDRILLPVDQPAENHNGGMIAFGPDGHLYVGFGDGGGGGDTYGNGQDRSDMLGSLLRLDVRGSGGYTIPNGNPFSSPDLPELWDYGLRNPWRFSFDRQTGDLYVADVGQNAHEEINVATAASGGGRGLNYGWPIMEGRSYYSPPVGCNQSGLRLPVLDYGHGGGTGQGCSVTGGYVYRGAALPSIRGVYFYGDYCGGWVGSFRYLMGQATEEKEWPSLAPGGNITSFGEDAAGELYILTSQGGVYRIVGA